MPTGSLFTKVNPAASRRMLTTRVLDELERIGVRWAAVREHRVCAVRRGMHLHVRPQCRTGSGATVRAYNPQHVKLSDLIDLACPSCVTIHAVMGTLARHPVVVAARAYNEAITRFTGCRTVAEAREQLAGSRHPEQEWGLCDDLLERYGAARTTTQALADSSDMAVTNRWAERFALWSAHLVAPIPAHLLVPSVRDVDSAFRRWATADPLSEPPQSPTRDQPATVDALEKLVVLWERAAQRYRCDAFALVVTGPRNPYTSATGDTREALTALHGHLGVGAQAALVPATTARLIVWLAARAGVPCATVPCTKPVAVYVAAQLLERSDDVTQVAALAAGCAN